MNKRALFSVVLLGSLITVGCGSTSEGDETVTPPLTWEIGDPSTSDYPEDYYAGGLLGTTTVNTATAFEQPTKAVENAGMMTAFNEGEYMFEKEFNTNTDGASTGWGPSMCAAAVSIAIRATDMAHVRPAIRLTPTATATCWWCTTS